MTQRSTRSRELFAELQEIWSDVTNVLRQDENLTPTSIDQLVSLYTEAMARVEERR